MYLRPFALCGGVFVLLLSPIGSFADTAIPQDIGTLGGTWSSPAAVNNQGQVVGQSALDGDTEVHAFSWTSKEGIVDLGTLGGPSSYAVAVTDAGVIVGNSTLDEDGTTHAFVWTPGFGMQDVGALDGWQSWAYAATPDGDAVGHGWTLTDDFPHVWRWNQETAIFDLGSLGVQLSPTVIVHSVRATVQGIQIVGGTDFCCAFRDTAFYWTSDVGPVDLGTFDGRPASVATAVNSSEVLGVVIVQVDSCGAGSLWPRVAAWNPVDGWQVLRGEACRNLVWPYALNEMGQFVGITDSPATHYYLHSGGSETVLTGARPPFRRAVLSQQGQVAGAGGGRFGGWASTPGHGSTDLAPLPGDDTTGAGAMNEQGDIVGISYSGSAPGRAVLWHVDLP